MLLSGRPSLRRQPVIYLLLVIVVLVAANGCLAPYDRVSDESITSIYKRLDSHINIVAASPADQPIDADFFTTLRSDLRALRLRTESRGDDPSLHKQAGIVDQLLIQIAKIEELERQGLRGTTAWQTAKNGVSTGVKAFLAAELARKDSGG